MNLVLDSLRWRHPLITRVAVGRRQRECEVPEREIQAGDTHFRRSQHLDGIKALKLDEIILRLAEKTQDA